MAEAASRTASRAVALLLAACALVALSAIGSAPQPDRAAALAASEPSVARPRRLPRAQTKPAFGEKSADEIAALFRAFQRDHARNYTEAAEAAYRFDVFKRNLRFIDKLNAQNPLAVFAVNRFADLTEDERARLRMTNNATTSWAGLKALLARADPGMAAAAERGRGAVEALAATRRQEPSGGDWFVSDDGGGSQQVEGWKDGVDFAQGASTTYEFAQGEVPWVTAEDCAACHRFPQLGQYSEGNLPADFDWRALGAVTSVKNQGYCGSCWSFSTAADVEGAYFLKTGELISLSNQQMVECSTQNYGCGGGYVWHAMQYVEHVGGLVSYDELPNKMVDTYDVMSTTTTPTCDKAAINADVQSSVETPWNTSSVAAITGFQMVAMGASFEELMRVALLKNGPISITLNANGMDFYHHGVVGCAGLGSGANCSTGAIDNGAPCDPANLDHAVLLVGYGSQNSSAFDSSLQDEIPYWVVKNSWGTDWGEHGYYRVVRGVNHCGIANFALHAAMTAH